MIRRERIHRARQLRSDGVEFVRFFLEMGFDLIHESGYSLIVMPMGPDFAKALLIPESHLGYVGGAYTAAACVSGLLGSLFLDKFDRRKALAVAMHTDGSPQFHRFLTPAEYHQRFDPDPGAVAAAVAHFNQAGLSTRLDAGNLLRVTGSAQAMQKAFGASLHVFDATTGAALRR